MDTKFVTVGGGKAGASLFKPIGTLWRTKCYLIGSMQYENGEAWRNEAETRLKNLGVIPLNPYKSPFLHAPKECDETHDIWRRAMAAGDFDFVSQQMKEIRQADLSMVDRSDFIICYLKTSVFSAGTMEEFAWAVRLKRPIFLVMEGGKAKTPFWILGMIPHKYIYNSFEEVYSVLDKIGSGEKEMDSDRWRLLRPEFR